MMIIKNKMKILKIKRLNINKKKIMRVTSKKNKNKINY
jgi:hypothetical protein